MALGHPGRWLERPSVLILQPGPRHFTILSGFCDALLRRSALLSARVQLDPSTSNRERLRIFLALMQQQALAEE
jgi:hypothetical protein